MREEHANPAIFFLRSQRVHTRRSCNKAVTIQESFSIIADVLQPWVGVTGLADLNPFALPHGGPVFFPRCPRTTESDRPLLPKGL